MGCAFWRSFLLLLWSPAAIFLLTLSNQEACRQRLPLICSALAVTSFGPTD